MAQRAAAARGGVAELVLALPGGHPAAEHEQLPAPWIVAVLQEVAAARVWRVASSLFERGTPGARVEALGAAAAKVGGVHTVCLPHDYDAVDLCGLLAWRLGAVAVTSAQDLRSVAGQLRLRRPAHGGRFLAELRVPDGCPLVVTVSGRGAASTAGTPATENAASGNGEGPGGSAADRKVIVETLELGVDLGCDLPDREVLAVEEPDTAPALGAAQRVVSVGRGLGDPAHLPLAQRLATALDAELAGSRPVIDSGWLPAERQVGSSGQTVSPDLYLALGISGAAQHLEGISGARCVVAINRDPDAPIFRVARYGIVGDLHEIVPALIAALSED
jgi:electron transfer flavoprotein alpha subunit